MSEHRKQSLHRAAQVGVGAMQLGSLGCRPTVDVVGVFFPAWLISASVGVVAAYLSVLILGGLPGQRLLAQSGLFFCSLTVTVGLTTWWVFFSGF